MKFGDNGEGKANATMEMLPFQYIFEVIHNGTRYRNKVDIREQNEVIFQIGGKAPDKEDPEDEDPDDENNNNAGSTSGSGSSRGSSEPDTTEVILPDEEIPAGPVSEEEISADDASEIPLEEIPGGELPQTGGISSVLLYGFGALLTAAGIVRRRKEEN